MQYAFNPFARRARSFLFACSFLGIATLAAGEEAFPKPFDTEPSPTKPLSANESASRIRLPEGFRATVFASEPDVCQPMSMTTDARGRLWVAENYTYSERPTVFNDQLRDRILIFEDSNNDGRYDKRTVFWEGAQRLMSIEIGDGGVWAICLPELVFIADKDGDDVPDAAPEVLLDGFVHESGSHTVANGLKFGPDGWIYGRQGILATSRVGKPGTPDKERTIVNVGIWRFHPTRHVFENVAYGTTNPWGMDWDSRGEMFFINTVIGHLWHVIPGAHYRRMSGGDLNPQIYDIIEQHADHVHWATNEVWTDVRKGVTDATMEAGGGHAHTGLMIYQGGQWPTQWKGKLLTVNYHGKRFNVERLERDGSGFVGRREPDAFIFDDPWFRGLDLIPSSDGNMYVSDWSDTGECHDNDGIHRSSGRIYKICFGEKQPSTIADISQQETAELIKHQLSSNDWLARMSRRVLANRANHTALDGNSVSALKTIVQNDVNPVHRLRAVWTLHVTNTSDTAQLTRLLGDSDKSIRVWAIRLLEDQSHHDAKAREAFLQIAREQLPSFAKQEQSGFVRLALASLLQKLPDEDRIAIAAALLTHEEDEGDHNQPLLLWCGILPLAESSPGRFEQLIAESEIPTVQRYGVRRLTEEIEAAPERLDLFLQAALKHEVSTNVPAILDGIADGLSGRRNARKPASWDSVQEKFNALADEATRDRLRILSAMFGDRRAIDLLREAAMQSTNSLAQRTAALQTLIDARAPDVQSTCDTLLTVPGLSITAAGGLAISDAPEVADRLLAIWPSLQSQDQNQLMNILISRPHWVTKVLTSVADGRIERARLGALQIRQIRGYDNADLSSQVDELVGKPEPTIAGAKPELIAKWTERLSSEQLAKADKVNGQAVFQTSCAVCHRLNGQGQNIGPDLTGAARDNLHYLLENILAPSAVLAKEYRQTTVLLDDGRVLVGTVKPSSPNVLKLQTTTELVALPKDEIVSQKEMPISMMPEGLLDSLDEAKCRDLIAYLMSK